MTSYTRYLAAAAAIGGLSAPLAAQNQYPYGYQQQVPQPYPGQPGYTYQQPYSGYAQPTFPGYAQPYGYNQGYGQNPVDQIIGQLLGNRYNMTDRQAVSRCASAAMVQAQNQYRGYGYSQRYGSPQGYGYPQGIARPAMRVTAITDVQRRDSGLRVRGLIDTGYGANSGYPGQYGYQGQAYAAGDLSFRCNVAYNGAVTDIRIRRNETYRRY
jgi:hypothetical protein